MKKTTANSEKAKPNAFPAKKRAASKVTFIAKTHGIKINEAWERFVMPAVDAEFDRCATAATAKTGA